MSSAPSHTPPPEFGPIDLVVLQGTSFCNLNCSYCYLSESSRRNRRTLPLDSIPAIFSRIFASPYLGDRLQVSWHSGEPLVLGTEYYESAIDAIFKLRDELCPPGFDLRFDIQTNGTLLDQRWCDLLKRRREVLCIGVSCDGPEFLHDAHRRTWGGKATHRQTCRGMDLLCENGLEFDVIAVVSLHSMAFADDFIDFFSAYRRNIREFHFNLLDEFAFDSGDTARRDLWARSYAGFLEAILAAFRRADDPSDLVGIRNISSFYERLFAGPEAAGRYDARVMSRPFKTLSVDADGNVSTFYAGLTADECTDLYGDGRGLLVGNLLSQDLDEIAASDKLQRIAADFEASHRACEAACEYFSLCSGGYNLVKHKRYGSFEATETPECFVQVKTFADTLLADIEQAAQVPGASATPA